MPTTDAIARELRYRVAIIGAEGAGKRTALQAVRRYADTGGSRLSDTYVRLLTPGLRPTPEAHSQRLSIEVVVETGPDAIDHALTRADGIVFVADSRRSRQAANAVVMTKVVESFARRGVDPSTMPLSLLINQRDHGDVASVESMLGVLAVTGRAWFLGAAHRGQGALDAIDAVLRGIFAEVLPPGDLDTLTRPPIVSDAVKAKDRREELFRKLWSVGGDVFDTALSTFGDAGRWEHTDAKARGARLYAGGDPPPRAHKENRELRSLLAFVEMFQRLEQETLDALAPMGGPVYPIEAPIQYDWERKQRWDVFWATLIEPDRAYTIFSGEHRHLEDADGQVTLGQLERWRAANVRSVLIVGNGVSLEARGLAALGFDVTALDVSSLATHFARHLPWDAECMRHYLVDDHGEPVATPSDHFRPGGSLQYACGDFRRPDVLPGPYDLVVGRRVFQCNMPDNMPALDAAIDRLRPGGFILVHEHNMYRHREAYRQHLRGRGFVLQGDGAGWNAIFQMSSG